MSDKDRMMRELNELDPSYTIIELGKLFRLINVPFRVNAGILTEDGEVLNNAPLLRRFEEVFSIPLSTDGQQVISWTNKRYRKMMVVIKCSANGVSYDYRTAYSSLGATITQTSLRNDIGNQIWYANAKTGTGTSMFTGDVPQGDGEFAITMDNNSAAAACVGVISIELSDPVR